MFCFAAEGKSFLSFCKKQDGKWYSSVFFAKDCEDLYAKLSKISSISEFYRANKKIAVRRKILHSPWTDEFPYLYGLYRRITPDREVLLDNHIGDAYDVSVLREFSNIVDFSYLPEYKYYNGAIGICKMLRVFPHVKTITLESRLLEDPVADRCISKSHLDGVIIRDSFKGFKNNFIPKSRIIGIEFFEGELSVLKSFKSLRYLGVSNSANVFNGIETLYLASRLTHLSINFRSDIVDIAKLKLFRNLEYLTVICANAEQVHSPDVRRCDNVPLLKDISFVSSLRNLKHLNLSHNAIQEVSPLFQLTQIRFLKLRDNRITEFGDISKLDKLKYLDLSGNDLYDLSDLGASSSLEFLNLSGNRISNLSFILGLTKLRFLNSSFNPLRFLLPDNKSSYSVTFLNLDGMEFNNDVGAKAHAMDIFKYENQRYLHEAMFHNFRHEVKDLLTSGLIERFNLTGFPNLEALSLRGAMIKEFPVSKYIERILFFDLRWNELDRFPDLSESRNLAYLNISHNKIVTVELDKLPESYHVREMMMEGVESNRVLNLSN